MYSLSRELVNICKLGVYEEVVLLRFYKGMRDLGKGVECCLILSV